MHTAPSSLKHAVPSNKFYPPHINAAQSLLRTHLLDSLSSDFGEHNKIIAIEAQAGQGKTTLAYQFVTQHEHKHLWYQIGREDSDPVLLLTALLHSLTLSLPTFTSPQLYEIISKGEINPLDLPSCANILLNDINRHLDEPLYIVFDDLHLLEGAEITNNLLSYIIDTSPPNLLFILTSRHPFELKSKVFRSRNAVCYLTTEDLALTGNEIEQLFSNVYQKSITPAEVKKLEDMTRGWAMGIVLAAHPFTSRQRKGMSGPRPVLDLSVDTDMLSYFNEEIFSYIPEELHDIFLKLSVLDEIHVDLALEITSIAEIGTILTEFTQENLFIYNLDSAYTIFRFHHLFQEFLQRMAKQVLGKEQIREIYKKSAKFFLSRELIDKALASYRLADDFAAMDRILQIHGLDLLAQNRTMTMLGMIQSIPEDILYEHAWLILFAGILGESVQPLTTLKQLQAAQRMFTQQEDELGELVCLAQMIYYCFVVSGRYKSGSELLLRAEELLIKYMDALSPNIRVMVQRNLAAGYCFFTANTGKARHYIESARQLSIEHGIRNFLASSIFIKAYVELQTGDSQALIHELELAYSLINDPLVSTANKFTLRVSLLSSLAMHGDIPNFFRQQQLVRNFIAEKVVSQTVAGAFISIWQANCLISLGKSQEALDTLQHGCDTSVASKSEHMQSQILQLQAFAHALQGNTRLATAETEEATRLREIAGGPFYLAYHYILAGAIYCRCGKKSLPKECFARGLNLAQQLPSAYLLSCGMLQRALFKILNYGEETALDDLKTGLETMLKNGFTYFWCWEKQSMITVLATAVKHGIERDFCRKIAATKMRISIDDEGNTSSLLQISILDGFSVSLEGQQPIGAEQFTPLQRELIGLLLTSKGKQINQDKVQFLLWPDSSPKQARQKLDTLLTRLRKTLSENLPVLMHDHIRLNKGILSLERTVSDLDQFMGHCEKGFAHYDRKEFWLAENRFASAISFWKGSRPSDTFRSDRIFEFEDHLLLTYEKASLCWATILEQVGRETEAIPLLIQLIEAHNLCEQGIKHLCRLYLKNMQPLKIQETLNRYAHALRDANYAEDEILEIRQSLADTLSTSEGATSSPSSL